MVIYRVPRAHTVSIRMGLDTICGLKNGVGTVYGVVVVVGCEKPTTANFGLVLHLAALLFLNLLSRSTSPLSKSKD